MLRKENQAIIFKTKGIIKINSENESEQHNSDNRQTSSDNENKPIIQETLDALTRKIQAVIGSCKMEKEIFVN